MDKDKDITANIARLKDLLSHQLVELADCTFTINGLFNSDSLHLDREYVFWRVYGLHEGMKSLVKTLEEHGLIDNDKPEYQGDTAKKMIDDYLQYPTQRVVGSYTTDRYGNPPKHIPKKVSPK
tara:strand:+ start:763 stop:1131 length:369 start_codon:yes stop_codon:yes gene_type:complete